MDYKNILATKDQLASRKKKHFVLLNKIIEELNKEENVDYIKEAINFFSPVLYIKQNTSL